MSPLQPVDNVIVTLHVENGVHNVSLAKGGLGIWIGTAMTASAALPHRFPFCIQGFADIRVPSVVSIASLLPHRRCVSTVPATQKPAED